MMTDDKDSERTGLSVKIKAWIFVLWKTFIYIKNY